jgi:hypothetical protein
MKRRQKYFDPVVLFLRKNILFFSFLTDFSSASCRGTICLFSSVAEPEPHLLVGAGVVTRCGSGSDGSGSDNGITHS